MQRSFESLHPVVNEALKILGIRNFLLGIHDAAFPSLPEEDIGRGSPYSYGAAEFLDFIASLGFNGVQLGPQGITTSANLSPYDGTVFSRNPLSLAPLRLIREPWQILNPAELDNLAADPPLSACRVDEVFARKFLKKMSACFSRGHRHGLNDKAFHAPYYHGYSRFRQSNAAWLERDALYEELRKSYGGRNWKKWEGKQAQLDKHLFDPLPGTAKSAAMRIRNLHHIHAEALDDYCFMQYLLAEQHREFRERCRLSGLKLYGDCQIGLSGRDAWYAQSFLLRDYVMGAPPSRTNPTGQSWNYPVLDPRQYTLYDDHGLPQPGPALCFLQERVDKLFNEFDGLRIDHPHGLVCPWVYRVDSTDPVKAVQSGARLLASPTLADHPGLAEFAIPAPEQINEKKARYDDHWVTSLDSDQVRRYAVLFDVIMKSARQNNRGTCEIACEILSTQPYPIKRVMELYGLGRFRVTQKADLDNPLDVYRSENAKPEDWLMLGNHDTSSLWQVMDGRLKNGFSLREAHYLCVRLQIPEKERERWTKRIAADTGELALAKFADLFVGPAQNIMVFFTDLLGIKQSYNKPGTVGNENWSLRLSPDYRRRYRAQLREKSALSIPRALAMAFRARGCGFSEKHRGLIKELESFK